MRVLLAVCRLLYTFPQCSHLLRAADYWRTLMGTGPSVCYSFVQGEFISIVRQRREVSYLNESFRQSRWCVDWSE